MNRASSQLARAPEEVSTVPLEEQGLILVGYTGQTIFDDLKTSFSSQESSSLELCNVVKNRIVISETDRAVEEKQQRESKRWRKLATMVNVFASTWAKSLIFRLRKNNLLAYCLERFKGTGLRLWTRPESHQR